MAKETALLTYDAAKERLWGTIKPARPFVMTAYSGGSRGHREGDPVKYLYSQAALPSSHLATTAEKLGADGRLTQRGGTLPAGHYICQYLRNHGKLHECIRLKPAQDAKVIQLPPDVALKFGRTWIPHGRNLNGEFFYIHGRGPMGSDGCIVPKSPQDLKDLNEAVRDFPGLVILWVKNVSFQLPQELGGRIVNWWEVGTLNNALYR